MNIIVKTEEDGIIQYELESQQEGEYDYVQEEWKLQQNLHQIQQSSGADSILSSYQSSLQEAESSMVGLSARVKVEGAETVEDSHIFVTSVQGNVKLPKSKANEFSFDADVKTSVPEPAPAMILVPPPTTNNSLPDLLPMPPVLQSQPSSLFYPLNLLVQPGFNAAEGQVQFNQDFLQQLLPPLPLLQVHSNEVKTVINPIQNQPPNQVQKHSQKNVKSTENPTNSTKTRRRRLVSFTSVPTTVKTLLPCPKCNRKFPKRKYLNYHIKTQHLTCKKCHERLPSEAALTEHYVKAHNMNGSSPSSQIDGPFCNSKSKFSVIISNGNGIEPSSSRTTTINASSSKSNSKATSSTAGSGNVQNETKKAEYVCPHCSKVYRANQSLQAHIVGVHGPDSMDALGFNCQFCPKSFTSAHGLKTHMGMTHESNSDGFILQCPACPRSFSKQWRLTRHLNAVHSKTMPTSMDDLPLLGHREDGHGSGDPYSELFMEKIEDANYTQLLKVQEVKEREPEPEIIDLSSDESDLEFGSQEKSVHLHLKNKSASELELEHSNSRIEDSYSNNSNSNEFHNFDEIHLEPVTVDGESPGYVFPCNAKDCFETFPTARLLQVHERNHFSCVWVCKVCLKLFRQNYLLKRHMTIHTGTTGHRCPVCPKFYTKRWNLRLHFQSSHEKEDPKKYPNVICPYCSGNFGGFQELKDHLDEYSNCVTGLLNTSGKLERF